MGFPKEGGGGGIQLSYHANTKGFPPYFPLWQHNSDTQSSILCLFLWSKSHFLPSVHRTAAYATNVYWFYTTLTHLAPERVLRILYAQDYHETTDRRILKEQKPNLSLCCSWTRHVQEKCFGALGTATMRQHSLWRLLAFLPMIQRCKGVWASNNTFGARANYDKTGRSVFLTTVRTSAPRWGFRCNNLSIVSTEVKENWSVKRTG